MTFTESQDNFDIGARLQQALAAYERRQYAQAQSAYENILCLEPRHFEALHMLGIIACQSGNAHRGIEFFSRALAVNPDSAAVHGNLGNAYKALRRLNEAITSYDRAIELKPSLAEVYFNRGNALADLQRLDEALVSYDRAIELRPDFAEAYSNRGNVLSGLGRLNEAQASYDRAIALRPGAPRAHVGLGSVLMALGQFERAFTSFVQALRIDPNLAEALNNFAALLRDAEIPVVTGEVRNLLVSCFENPAIDSEAVVSASTATLLGDLKSWIQPEGGIPANVLDLDHRSGGLLITHLMSCPIMDVQLEGLLARIRAHLLRRRQDDNEPGSRPDADLRCLIALARQGFLNEFVWSVSDEEREEVGRLETAILAMLRTGKAPAMRDLFLLAAYRPLHEVEGIRSWCMAVLNEFQGLARASFEYLVVNPMREAELAADTEQLTMIDDPVSLSVKSQYEQNPYPRWDSLNMGKPMHFLAHILKEIAPHRPKLDAALERPRVLIAGCGSGKHPISCALRLRDADVVAIDLSRASLAHARRKAMEFGVANIRFAQADILKLPAAGERYDVVECTGVLHHMADPRAGLEALLSVLEPKGFIKIGLYSERARRDIIHLRNLMAHWEFSSDLEGIRSLRQALIQADIPETRMIRKSRDFYATSAVRDLLMHVQEHRFCIPQIRELIEEFRLEFLGFVLLNPLVKLHYAKQYRDDPACLNLGNWHRFEMENPDTFWGMYQFWCRKPR